MKGRGPLGFWEWGCPKRGVAHITVTPARLAERFGALNLSPQWVPGLTSIYLYYFCGGPNRLHQSMAQKLSDVTPHARSLDRRSVGQR